MKNITNTDQLYRRRTGEHLIWLQQKQISQKLYKQHCKNISARPGLHSGNVIRQNVTYALLPLLSVLSLVQNNSTVRAVKTKYTDSLAISRNEYSVSTLCPQIPTSLTVLPTRTLLISPCVKPPTRVIKPVNSLMATIIQPLSILMNKVDYVILRYDPLHLPAAAAVSVQTKQQDSIDRWPRYVAKPTIKSIPTSVVDDVKVVQLYDFSCLNGGENLSFSEALKQISESLRQPLSKLTAESIKIDRWRKGQACPGMKEIKEVSQITETVDNIVSQIMGILPYSKPLSIIQSIVVPLLSRAADELKNNPLSPEKDLSLLQEIAQQGRISIITSNHMAQASLTAQPATTQKKTPLQLPTFYIKNGINHIDLEKKGQVYRIPVKSENGKVYALVPKGSKGIFRRHQVYFNYLEHKWKTMGNGRFNRFSKKEQQLVYRLSLSTRFIYQHQNGNIPALYTVLNPYAVTPEKLSAVEMFGQLVPFRYHSGTNQFFIYNAKLKSGPTYEIVLARNQWHLKLPASKKVKYVMLFSPEYGRTLKVDMIREKNGKKIYAQINTDTGFLWGERFTCNKYGHLELLSPPGRVERYYKNTIIKSLVAVKNKDSGNEKKHPENNNDVMFYEQRSGCFRIKRGAALSHICAEGDDGQPYPMTQGIDLSKYPVIATGSIGTVYDYQQGIVIKKYKGKIDERHKSRLIAANNNVKGFNRYYGASSATLEITSNGDGSSSVFVKLKKINGIPLNMVQAMTDRNKLNALIDIIQNGHPAEHLSRKLQQLGITHHDINKGNVIYDGENGFHIIDFDSADYLPTGEMVSPSMTATMKSTFTYVFKDVLRDVQYRLEKLNDTV